MKRCFHKAIAFTGAVAIMAMLSMPCMAAESKPAANSRVLLENTYDTVVNWNNGALFIKNGSMDSITDKTELELVKPDGGMTALTNKNKFDKIYYSSSGAYYTCDSNYLIVGKNGKKALLKEDGSFVSDTLYDDILTATDHYMVVKENNQYVVRRLDSTLVKTYPAVRNFIRLKETDHGLIIIDGSEVIGLFDNNLKEIDLSAYDNVFYFYATGNYMEARSGDYSGLIDDTGKEIIPPDYSNIEPFTYKGVTYFNALYYDDSSRTQTFTVFNADGSVLIGETDGYMQIYSLDSAGGFAEFFNGSYYGIYDFNNKTIKIEPTYNRITSSDRQYFSYIKGNIIGVKSYDGKTVFESDKYDDNAYASICDDKYIIVTDYSIVKNDITEIKFKTDVYSFTGKLLFSSDNSRIFYYKGTFLNVINTDNKQLLSILDENGNKIVSSNTYDDLERLYGCDSFPNALWLVSKNGKVGIIDSKGRAVVDVNYQSLGKYTSEDNYADSPLFDTTDQKEVYICTKQNDKFGLIELSPVISASGLSLDKTEASIKVGETVTLTPKFTPADTDDQQVAWTSSDETVATVKDGVVTALKAGTVTITATSEDGWFKAACTVTVTEVTATTTINTTEPTNTVSPTESTQNETNPTATQEATKSPATGESPTAAGIAFTVLAASSLAAGLALKKK